MVKRSGQGEPAGDGIEEMVHAFQQSLGSLDASQRELARLSQRAERTVGELESYNREIMDSLTSGVLCFTSRGEICMANPAARRILRISAATPLLGKTAQELWGGESPLGALVADSLAAPRNRSRIEIRVPHEEGGETWVGVSVSVLHERGGDAGGLILLMSDLTEVRALRAELSVRQRLGAMGELTACIAHNFRNSLAAILGQATLLSRRAGAAPEVRRPIEAILREVHQMEKEIRALLEGLRLDPSLESALDAGEVVRGVVAGLRPACESRGVRLEARLPEHLPAVRGDAGALGQLVTNLVRNGIQATGAGGRVTVALAAKGNDLEIEVEDTGEGIPLGNLARVFQPFFSTREGGAGLGLALVKSAVDRLGGGVELESEPGRGTRVRVRLPLAGASHGN